MTSTAPTTDHCNNYYNSHKPLHALSTAVSTGDDGLAGVVASTVAAAVATNTMPSGSNNGRSGSITTANIAIASSNTEMLLAAPRNRRSRLGDIFSAVVSSTSQALGATASVNRRGANTTSSSTTNGGSSTPQAAVQAGGSTITGNRCCSSHDSDRIAVTMATATATSTTLLMVPGVERCCGVDVAAGSGTGGVMLTAMPMSVPLWSTGGGNNGMQQLSTSWEYLR